jgi:hypothetical protein
MSPFKIKKSEYKIGIVIPYSVFGEEDVLNNKKRKFTLIC